MISNQRGSTVQDAPSYGVTWGGVPLHARRAMTVAVATLVAAGLAGPASAAAATQASSAENVSVIVRELSGAGNAPEQAVSAFGGSLGRQLAILGGFTAEVPSDRLAALRGVAGVESSRSTGWAAAWPPLSSPSCPVPCSAPGTGLPR
jgi:serine protease AprX